MITIDSIPAIMAHIRELNGVFRLSDIVTWFEARTIEDRTALFGILRQAEADGHIVKAGMYGGTWRPVDLTMKVMSLDKPKEAKLPIELPFLLHDVVNLSSKQIILCAGEKDSGKSSFALNTAFLNRDTFEVRYFNSEMGEMELQNRLLQFPTREFPWDEWKKITFIERSSKFEDLILPDGLNIIDFLEIGKDFFEVAVDIKRVFDKLDKGLILIVMQKRSYKEYAVGGEATLEKARLAINLEHGQGGGICRITVAKNASGKLDWPKGKVCRYKVIQGGPIIMTDYWHEPGDGEAKTTNAPQPFKRKLKAVTSNGVSRVDPDFPEE